MFRTAAGGVARMVEIGVVHAGWGASADAARAATCDRELLEVLLTAYAELSAAVTSQTRRLRALLLRGDTADRTHARGTLCDTTILRLGRRRARGEASEEHIRRNAEIRRLALVVRDYRTELAANRHQLATLVNELAVGLTSQPGMGPVTAAKAIVSSTPTPKPTTDQDAVTLD